MVVESRGRLLNWLPPSANYAGSATIRLQIEFSQSRKSHSWATSSVVRALPSHGRGPRFKSLVAHHSPFTLRIAVLPPIVDDAKSGRYRCAQKVLGLYNALTAGEHTMNSVLRFVQVFALGTWVGSIIYFVVIYAGDLWRAAEPRSGRVDGGLFARAAALFGDGCGGVLFGGGHWRWRNR